MSFNVVPIHHAAPEPGSALDYALRYAALGWHVFPVWPGEDGHCTCRTFCKSPAKHPISHLVPRGQDDATTDPATIRRWWGQYPDASIGVFLFPSGLLAIDIDPRNGGYFTIEIIEIQHGDLVSDVMATTQGGGQHRIFSLRSDVAVTLPGKLGDGVDVKRNGYIVLPPSKGVMGEYTWEPSSDPLEGCIPSPLPDWLRDLSAPLAPSLTPEEAAGCRYCTPEQVEELRDALTCIPADERDTWINVGMALATIGASGWELWNAWSQTSAKYDRQDQTRVWRSFKRNNGRNIESVFFEAQRQGWVNPLGEMAPEVAPIAIETVRLYQVPAEQLRIVTQAQGIPGILGQVEDWINATSRKSQPMFARQAALAFGATILGRRYVTPQRNWPSLYFLNIGKSASGKEHSKWAIEALLESCQMDHLIGPSFYTSDSGVLSALLTRPSHITIIDEFGKIVDSARVKNSPRSASAMTKLIEAFSKCDGTLRPQGYSTFGMSQSDADKMNSKVVRNPALTLLAMTTPDSFFDAISSSSVRDGFLNRFLIVESDIGRQVGEHVAPTPVSEDVIQWATGRRQHQGLVNPDIAADMPADPVVVPFTTRALAVFSEFEAECVTLMNEHEHHGLDEMFGRSNEIAMRLSLTVANSCLTPVIEREHAEWAVAYVRSHAVATAERMKTSIADSEFEAASNQVLNLIRSTPKEGRTQREIYDASRKYRALDQRGRINILNTLIFSGDVAKVSIKSLSGRGRPREAYVAIQPGEEEDA